MLGSTGALPLESALRELLLNPWLPSVLATLRLEFKFAAFLEPFLRSSVSTVPTMSGREEFLFL